MAQDGPKEAVHSITESPFVIQGAPKFEERVRGALSILQITKTGKELIQGILDTGHKITIRPTADANAYCQATDPAAAQSPGAGSDSTIAWNPDHTIISLGDQPGSVVILGSQLVHAYHNARGTNANGLYYSYPGQSGASALGEERLAAGLGESFVVSPEGGLVSVPDQSEIFPSENSLRDDIGIPRRRTYFPLNWPGGPPW